MGAAASSVSLRERTHFSGRKWSRMPNTAGTVPANKQTAACRSYYITIIHRNNTSHAAAAAVISNQIDWICKFSAFIRSDPPDPHFPC